MVVKKDPVQIKAIDMPSTFQENFSPRIMGERIAVKIMEKPDVEDIRIIFPKKRETIKS